MANPQVEEGFVMIALDLFVALMSLDLPNREAVILAEVLSHCYGPSKRRKVPLDLVNMEDHTGIHRNNIRRAIAGLIDANIIARNDDGTYRFLKDWESYRPGGESFVDRLGGKLAVFARGVKVRLGRIKPSAKDPIPLDSPAIPLDSGKSQNRNPTGLGFSQKPQSIGIGPTADINENGCDVNRSTPMINENMLAPARAHAPEDANIMQDKNIASSSARFTAISPEHRESISIALDLFGEDAAADVSSKGIDITDSVRGPKALTGPEKFACYSAALREMRRRADAGTAIRKLHVFTLRIANDYATSGIPSGPIAVASRANDDLSPSQRRRENQLAAFRKFAESGTDDEPDDSTEAHSNGQK